MNKLLIISGAGISAESGVPTFRTETEGGPALWDKYRLNDVCTINQFDAGFDIKIGAEYPVVGGMSKEGENLYDLTHEFYNRRRVELASVKPNGAHYRTAVWDSTYPGRVHHVTTNVDDLFERSGIPHEDIIHVHGYLPRVVTKATEDSEPEIKDIGYYTINPEDYYWAKPDVVFFGEGAPEYQKMFSLFREFGKGDLVILVGCSNQVIDFYWEICPMVDRGAKAVVINPELTMNEKCMMEKYGIEYFECGAVKAFDSDKLNTLVTQTMEVL